MLSETLWKLNHEIAEQCLAHPFIAGLGAGTLLQPAFKRYVAQDVFFLQAYLRAQALCVAKSKEMRYAQAFHGLMSGALHELDVHAQHSKALGIDLEKVVPYRETLAYTDFLMRTAWHEDVGKILAAMTPCMRLYAYLGAQLSAQSHPEHPYRLWIETYSSQEFQQLAQTMENLLDEHAADSSEIRYAYNYAMRCELDFFGAPMEETV